MTIELTLTGAVKPYVRMTQRGKWTNAQAHEYLASRMSLALQAKAQMAGRAPLGRVPLRVHITFAVSERMHTKDLDNLIKAVLDALNGVVWEDDRWVDEISAVRRLAKDDKTIIRVEEAQ